MADSDNAQALKDALEGHQITDETGQMAEEKTDQEIVPPQETPVEESEKKPEQETEETDPEVAEDESGKKYVPEGRFKEVYAKYKELERKLASDKQPQAPTQQAESPTMPGMADVNTDRAAMLETEFLHQTLPQFNPNSGDYSPVLDEMGAEIYKSSFRFDPKTGVLTPGITKLEAGRRAIERARKLAGLEGKIKQEARQVKSDQADSGITTVTRKVGEKEPQSLEEMEAYLKKHNAW